MSIGGSNKVKETAHEKELARVRDEYSKQFFSTYAPEELKQISEIQRLRSEPEKDKLAGRYRAAVYRNLGEQTPGPGFAPTSGRFLTAGTERTAVAGQALGSANTNARMSAEKATTAGLQSSIAMGRDLEARGVDNLSRAAGIAQQEEIARAQASADKQEAVGTAIGIAGYGFSRMGGNKKTINASDVDTSIIDYNPSSASARRIQGMA
jgi:hypothetical protein